MDIKNNYVVYEHMMTSIACYFCWGNSPASQPCISAKDRILDPF